MYGKVKADVREIIRTLCRYKKVEIDQRSRVGRSCAFLLEYTTEDGDIRIHGILEGKIDTDDL